MDKTVDQQTTQTDQNYRTREDEEKESRQKKVRFADISMTAAWTAATYQAFTPEQIRENIQGQWVNKVAADVSKDPKFKDIFAPRQKNESREQYTERRIKQVQTRQMISDLVGSYGDELYTTSPETKAEIKETMTELINIDYKDLKNNESELLEAVTKAQTDIAPHFKQINDKNNGRFNGKGLYRRTEKDLENIKNKEKLDYQTQKNKSRAANSSQTNYTAVPEPSNITPSDSIPRISFPRIDLRGLNNLFKNNLGGIYKSIGSGLSKLSGFLTKLPGIGSFFGGGAAVGGGAAAAGATGAAATGAAAAVGGGAAAAGAAGATATVGVWGPIVIVGGVVLLLILILVLTVFNNPSVQPQAIIETLTPIPTTVL